MPAGDVTGPDLPTSRRRILAAAALLLSGAAWPARAQAAPRRVGVILAYAETDPEAQDRVAALLQSLLENGLQPGRNILLDVRYSASDLARTEQYVADFIAAPVDLMIVNGTQASTVASRATRQIPILFVGLANPVGGGFVPNLAHPGGNLTGFSTFEPEIGGKWFELLREAAPALRKVGLVTDPVLRGFEDLRDAAAEAARKNGVLPVLIEGSTRTEIGQALAGPAAADVDGLIVMPASTNGTARDLIIGWANQRKIPAIYPFSFYGDSGGLLSYGFDSRDLFRRAASYAARILAGAAPGTLPVQAPVKYDLTINLASARAMGLTIPQSLLQRASDIIE